LDRHELRRRREALGLTQEKVAELVGLTHATRRSTVYRWEIGERPIPAAHAKLLDYVFADLEGKAKKKRGKRS